MYMTGRQLLYEVLNEWSDRSFTLNELSNRVWSLNYVTTTKMVRQLLLCGYLARPERWVYTVLHKIPEDLSCKKLERQARQVLEDRRKNGTPPISEDYNYKNKKR